GGEPPECREAEGSLRSPKDGGGHVARDGSSLAERVLCRWRMEAAGPRIGHERAVTERPYAGPVRNLKVLVHENAPPPRGDREGGRERIRDRAGRPEEGVRLDRPSVAEDDNVVLDAADLGAGDDLNPACGELPLGVGAELGAQFGENEGVGGEQDHSEVLLAEVRIEAERLAHEVVDPAEGFDTREPAARHYEREQRLPHTRRALGVRLLEVCDQSVAEHDRIAERLHSQRATLHARETTEVRARPAR